MAAIESRPSKIGINCKQCAAADKVDADIQVKRRRYRQRRPGNAEPSGLFTW
jgi:hypothetical protein